jgi:hypothetical protein
MSAYPRREKRIVLRCGIFPILGALCGAYPSEQPQPCDELQALLEAVPHVALTQTVGSFESIWRGGTLGGGTFEGCVIEFETNDVTRGGVEAPDFFPDEGSDLHRAGWRMAPGILADGAGTGVHGIERESTLCIIRWEQPAYVDDDGDIVSSDTLTILIQCADRVALRR